MRLNNIKFQAQPHMWPEPSECDCMECSIQWLLQMLHADSPCYQELEDIDDPNVTEPDEKSQQGAALVYGLGRLAYEIGQYNLQHMSADERSLLMAEPVGFT